MVIEDTEVSENVLSTKGLTTFSLNIALGKIKKMYTQQLEKLTQTSFLVEFIQ